MRHTAFHCTHRKSAHYSEIDQDEDNRVTKVKNKTFLRPKPKWWLPTDVAEILDMKAIQQTMTERHKADWERIEALSNREEAEDHDDPSTPKTVHMDNEPTVADRTIHPDADVWQKANRKTKPEKQQKKKGNQKQGPKDPQSTPPNPQPFKINTPAKPNKPPKGKGNPIPIPGENHRMTTDFMAAQFTAHKKYNPPPQPIPNSNQGIHKSYWNPNKSTSEQSSYLWVGHMGNWATRARKTHHYKKQKT
ncbi:hypothetical protein DSO57_1013915 [Entomophthora muscae]|uniref:Uncharacterized protein n=1 Tax=Entomophthora muscae TaxID=34485 RepID=A0ACC2UFN0_9FUNG|nr:hypothetical protein DSO57_1013915 [Entomophthora muscae]